jgi:uncharacterized membrane protein YphA (DoxX/SURF4 family)
MALTRRLARPLLASVFFVGGVSALKSAEPLSDKARRVTDRLVPRLQEAGVPVPSDPQTLVRINAVTQLVAAGALATGRAPRFSAAVLAGSLVPTTLAGHAFWDEKDPAARKAQRLQFAKNSSVLGGLILAALDTEGKPGVAWRARRAARDVRRETGRLAHDARREAKLAAKSMG